MTDMTITTGHATREGTAADNADAARIYVLADGTTGAAVVDGIGHGPHTSSTTPLLAAVAARYAAHRGALAGTLGAALLVADREALDGDEADAVAVVARSYPDAVRVAWVGDCRAYGWNGTTLTLYTTDQTMAAWVGRYGPPVDVVRHYGDWVRVSLASASVASVGEVEITEPVVILTSDGVHDQIAPDALEDLVRDHADAPQALATALVGAAQPDADGYRDDATAIVIHRAE